MLLDNRCYLTLNMPSLWTLTRSSKGWQPDRHGSICLLLVVSVSLLNCLPLWQDYAWGKCKGTVAFYKGFSLPRIFPERLWWDTRLACMGLKTTWPCRKCSVHGSGVGTWWSFKDPSNPNLSVILWFCLNNSKLSVFFWLNFPNVWNHIPDFHYHWILVFCHLLSYVNPANILDTFCFLDFSAASRWASTTVLPCQQSLLKLSWMC